MLHQSGFLPEPIAKVRNLYETRKKLRNNLLYSEFYRDSTKKNALFFVFAARKFANIGRSSYLCKVRNDYPVSFRVGARLDRHYSIFYKRVTLIGGSFTILCIA